MARGYFQRTKFRGIQLQQTWWTRSRRRWSSWGPRCSSWRRRVWVSAERRCKQLWPVRRVQWWLWGLWGIRGRRWWSVLPAALRIFWRELVVGDPSRQSQQVYSASVSSISLSTRCDSLRLLFLPFHDTSPSRSHHKHVFPTVKSSLAHL